MSKAIDILGSVMNLQLGIKNHMANDMTTSRINDAKNNVIQLKALYIMFFSWVKNSFSISLDFIIEMILN